MIIEVSLIRAKSPRWPQWLAALESLGFHWAGVEAKPVSGRQTRECDVVQLPNPPNSDRNRSAAGWLTSAVLHGSVLLVLVWSVPDPLGGTSIEPTLTTRIVLDRISDDSAQEEATTTEEEFAGEPSGGGKVPAAVEVVREEIEPNRVETVPADELASEPVEERVEISVPLLPEDPPAPTVVENAASIPPLVSTTGSIFDGLLAPSVATGKTNTGAGGGWPRLSGGKARVQIFGVEGTGTRFVYLFDRSVSMEGTPLAVAKRQLIQSLDSLDSIHQFQIIFFNHRMSILDSTDQQQRIAYATDRNKSLAEAFIGTISADGGTDRYAAIRQAIRLRPDAIFFLTDADDPMPAAEIAKVLFDNRRVGAAIHTIEFGRGVEQGRYNFLVQLAEQSGGQYGYVNTRLLSPAGQ